MQAISVAGLILYFPASLGHMQTAVRAALACFVLSSMWIWHPWSGIHRIVCFAHLLITVLFKVDATVKDAPVQCSRKVPHSITMAQKRHQYGFTLLVVAQSLASMFYAQAPGSWAISVLVCCLAFWIAVNLRKQVVVQKHARVQFRVTPPIIATWRVCSLIGAYAELSTESFITYACVVVAAPVVFGFLEFKRDVLEAFSLYTDASLCVEAFTLPLFAFLGTWGAFKSSLVVEWIALAFSATTVVYTIWKLFWRPRFYDDVMT